jgi:Zn-dependent protease with chaperone function
MNQHVAKSWTRLAIFIGSVLLCGTAQAEGLSIRQLGAEQLRLTTIGYRLGAANRGTCASPKMLSGMVLHDLTEYQAALRPAVSDAFSLHDGIGVLEIVPGSVADAAHLEVDDEILAVNGASVEDAAATRNARQSYKRMDRFLGYLASALSMGPADLLIRRKGEMLHVALHGQPACGGDPFLINSSDLNAWSDGSRVFVSSAMMRIARSDDELAFVVAHEMAHNILGHSSRNDAHGLLGLFGFGASKMRREEMQADLMAVPLMGASGFNPAGAVEILDGLRHILWWDLSLDHPGFGERIRLVTAEIAEESRAAWSAPRLLAFAPRSASN